MGLDWQHGQTWADFYSAKNTGEHSYLGEMAKRAGIGADQVAGMGWDTNFSTGDMHNSAPHRQLVDLAHQQYLAHPPINPWVHPQQPVTAPGMQTPQRPAMPAASGSRPAMPGAPPPMGAPGLGGVQAAPGSRPAPAQAGGFGGVHPWGGRRIM